MKPHFFYIAFILTLTFSSPFGASANNGNKNTKSNNVTPTENSDDEYSRRLENISEAFPFMLSPKIKEGILAATGRGKATTERMLGLSHIYFPVFETYLAINDMPQQLKYIPVVESQFQTHAVSPKGAGGLWQIMPGTAGTYGLTINNMVDERLDLHKSTEVAVRLMKALYTKYGDWAVVLAAYNAGPVKINNAIKAAKSNDYWDMCKFLPLETQRYVPQFIVAAYMGHYYYMHDLLPQEQPEEYVLTDTIKVYNGVSFNELSEQTGVSTTDIKYLNPSFLQNFIPTTKDGYIITLPLKSVAKLKGFKTTTLYAGSSLADAATTASEGDYQTTTVSTETEAIIANHIAGKDEKLEDIAVFYHCTADQIRRWNNMAPNSQPASNAVLAIKEMTRQVVSESPAVAQQEVKVETASAKPNYTKTNDDVASASNKSFIEELSVVEETHKLAGVKTESKSETMVKYQLGYNDNIFKILTLFPSTTIDELNKINGIERMKKLKPGDVINLKKKS